MDFRIVALFLTLVAVGLVNGNQKFTYTVINELPLPYINETIQLEIIVGRKLNTYMKDACEKYPNTFTSFTITYRPADGYLITAINGVPENCNNKTYWQISNATGPIGVDVFNYIPVAND